MDLRQPFDLHSKQFDPPTQHPGTENRIQEVYLSQYFNLTSIPLTMMTFRKMGRVFLLGLLMSCMPQTEEVSLVSGVSVELAAQRKATINNIVYDLKFNIPEKLEASIPAEITISFNLEENNQSLILDFRAEEGAVKSVLSNNQTSGYRFEEDHIVIPQTSLKKGANLVKINFLAGEGSLNRNEEYLYTLLVPDRASTVFPCFDQPDLKARYDLTLAVPKEWKTLANGSVKNEQIEGDRKTVIFETSDLISTYLFSFVAGEFEVLEEERDGLTMRMFHRESDSTKVAANQEKVFDLHFKSLRWLEAYTGIDYPFQKFDFALIPSFQYGGMEHVGAIQYRASSLFLDKSATKSRELGRARLIAHETAHMWFGNLVTMEWFNDVWMKEVFANFMAAKIANADFPEINHDLSFLISHYPASYSVDRTSGANPVRQQLDNLKFAGTMYGAIIYNKAPIVMKQLELLVGEEGLREGLRQYLTTYADSNATWPDLIDILDKLTSVDLQQWSQVWINEPGRPVFELSDSNVLTQKDPWGENRLWPQKFSIVADENTQIDFADKVAISAPPVIVNADGLGYGVFPVTTEQTKELFSWEDEVKRGATYIALYENLLEGRTVDPSLFIKLAVRAASEENNPLNLRLMMGYLRTVYWSFHTSDQRTQLASELEKSLWRAMNDQSTPDMKKHVFNAYQSVVLTENGLERLYQVWNGDLRIKGMKAFSQVDLTDMAQNLALKLPTRSKEILDEQSERITNEERKAKFEFVRQAISPEPEVRSSFFESLKNVENRAKEPWVLDALGYLHHPLRQNTSKNHLKTSLELLAEIQQTGDIFFPKRWLDATFSSYQSEYATEVVDTFLKENPDYDPKLKGLILQSTDMAKRASQILSMN